MRKYCLFAIMALVVACTTETELPNNEIYYPAEVSASIDDEAFSPETKVYADENLKVLWDNDDRISLFNKYTYNKEYRFAGSTGANSGTFKEVSTGDIVVGNELDYVYAVYPYQEMTEISNSGVITLDLPAEQSYKENSFGRGANTMVSATTNTELLFKNLCGYLVLKLYGDDVSVSSISIKGNNHEVLAGAADVTAAVGSVPSLSFRSTGTSEELTLTCETPVTLGATAADATVFWLVVPPQTFTNGFTLTVTDAEGNTFEQSAALNFEIKRNKTFRMGALEVIMTPNQNSFIEFADSGLKSILVSRFDTNEDGEISYEEAEAVTDIGVGYGDIRSFDEFRFFRNVTEIKKDAFRSAGFNILNSIILPESITTIGSRAFANHGIIYIKFPKNLQFIGNNAFVNGWVETIEITDLATWCNVVFDGLSACPSLTHFWFDGTAPNPILLVDGEEVTSLVIPDGVLNISSCTFAGYNQIESIHLPSSIESIGSQAFWACGSLKSVNFPVSLTTISQYAFRHCSSLERFEIEDLSHWCSVEIKGDLMGTYSGEYPQDFGIWHNGEYITELEIPEGVVKIGDYAFAHCGKITGVSIPESVKEIGASAFAHCNSLTDITIPNNLRAIGSSAFANSGIVSISLPESIEIIDGAFESCKSLISIVLSSGITSIGPRTFANCQALSSLIIPNSVTSIGPSAFSGCSSLNSVNIPENVKTIEYGVFYGCGNLSSITIPDGITSIGERSFYNCASLQTVSLPESTTSIDYYAFYGCSNLNKVIINSRQTITVGKYMFDNTNSCPIYVHSDLIETYLLSESWSNYADRIRGFDNPDWIIGSFPFPGYVIMAMQKVNVQAGQTVNANMSLWDGGEGYVSWMTGQSPQYVNGVDEGTISDEIRHTYTEDYSGYIYALSCSGRYSYADGMTLTIISIE